MGFSSIQIRRVCRDFESITRRRRISVKILIEIIWQNKNKTRHK